jgi:hypothetical protein
MGEAYGIAAPPPSSSLHGIYAEAIERAGIAAEGAGAAVPGSS